MKVFCNPTPVAAAMDLSNSINQIVWRMTQMLPSRDIELTSDHSEAALFACHAGMSDGHYADVAHISGLYPTFHFPQHGWHWDANAHVIANVRGAKTVTVPSQWVADLFARDMHLETQIVPWGVDCEEWQPPEVSGQQPYVLWNKTRIDGICNPESMNALAKAEPKIQFYSTFGNEDQNVRLTGRLTYKEMSVLVRHASIYLATTLETFGIGTLEAMACGVPILGYKWGGTADIVTHGETGYLVEPGDIEGLREGLYWCMKHRQRLGENARTVAKQYSWERTADLMAGVYWDTHDTMQDKTSPKVSVVIPVHNYAQYVDKAMASALVQVTNFDYEVVVVDDASTDESAAVARQVAETFPRSKGAEGRVSVWVNGENRGVAFTRNRGVDEAHGEYIVCLDADDMLASDHVLQLLSDAMDKRPDLGIVYGSLQMMDATGNIAPKPSDWPTRFNADMHYQHHNQVPTCCMFRKSAWERAGGYRARFTPAEDADLWTRILKLGIGAEKVTDEATLLYRLHEGSLSSVIREGQKAEPDWLFEQRWATDPKVGRPFACYGVAPSHSWAVRNYCLPAVSVIIPLVQHHAGIVLDAIDSIESQTYPFWELIIVVDGVLDGRDWVRLMKAAPYARFVVSNDEQKTMGAGVARNVGAKHAAAPLLAFLDADDMFHPDFLAETLKYYRRTGKYVYTDWRSLNKVGVYEDNDCPEYSPNLVFERTSIHSVSILIDKTQFWGVGGFDETMPSWEDTDLQMKLAAHGFCGVRVPRKLLMYRYSTGQRREIGESMKQQLIGLLRSRYSEYVEGHKVCMCGQPNGIHMPPNFGFTVNSNEGLPENTVRIRYAGGEADHQVIGAATKTDYRNHQYGDYFVVYLADAEAQPRLFVIEPELPVLHTPTPVPPEPELISA